MASSQDTAPLGGTSIDLNDEMTILYGYLPLLEKPRVRPHTHFDCSFWSTAKSRATAFLFDLRIKGLGHLG